MTASPPGGNTKPVPATVKAALAKAKEKVAPEPQAPTVTTEHTYDPQHQAHARSAVARQIERKTGRPTGDPMSIEEARKLTDRIKFDAEQLWDKVIDAFLGRADVALGYASWDAYCTQEFPTSRLRLPREERSEVVPSLRDAGFSDRAIESATGISRRTLIRDRQRQSGGDIVTTSSGSDVDEDGVVDAEVVESKPVTGLDGKTYPNRRPTPKPKPNTPKPLAEIKTWVDGRWYEYESWDEVFDVLNRGCSSVGTAIVEAGRSRTAKMPVTDARELQAALCVLLDDRRDRGGWKS